VRTRSKVVLIAALGLMPQVVGAQAGEEARTGLGPLAGFSRTTTTGDTVSDWRPAFTLGLQLRHAFRSGAFVRTGLAYSLRGAGWTEGGFTSYLNLQYLEVPILFGYGLRPTARVRPFAMAGAQLGLLLKCTVSAVLVSVKCDDASDPRSVARTDLALVGGGGVELAVHRGTVTVDARYVLGIVDIEKESGARNRGYTLAVSYTLPISRR